MQYIINLFPSEAMHQKILLTVTVGRLFSRATNFAKRAKALFSGNYFQELRAATYMIMINSCIYVIFR